MQLVQAHGPRADLAEGGVGLRECDMLRVLHAVLAFDKGYQSEGLQLLAWHIGARKARRGRGSREISQEDSGENSSLSKCHCSVPYGFNPRHRAGVGRYVAIRNSRSARV